MWSFSSPVSGWLAAAACLVFVFVLRERAASERSVLELRDELLARAPQELVQRTWSATEDELVKDAGISGDVVWDGASQQGFVKLSNMPSNDPTKNQYQLWIFDKSRSADYPVSAGVFDVPASGEVAVELREDLPIDEPFLFAVTLEQPGGVVVSDRSRLLLVASVD